MIEVLEQEQASDLIDEVSESAVFVDEVSECDATRRYATLTFMRGAVVSLSISLLAGLLGAIYYIPVVSPIMQRIGLHFTALRPIHTTFAVAFIFLAGVAVVHRYFEDVAGPVTAWERRRLRIQVGSWAIAGIGILISYFAGAGSGREYMGFHPLCSIPILLGWVMFVWNFYTHLGKGLFSHPIHVTMWAVGTIFFMYTFIEQHAWLLNSVFSDPIRDMRIQWKATGTLVGSFNLFVYGSLYYLTCKLTGCTKFAHSKLAYALFSVGLLNSFTNFAHHTYHLPQSHLVKWISFVVSMAEIILLARVVWELCALVKAKGQAVPCSIRYFMVSTKWWTGFILITAITISIPPINSLIHGTRVVMGHAMGAEIGICAMALFASLTWLMIERRDRSGSKIHKLQTNAYRRWIVGFNLGVIGLVGWLTISGIGTAITRYEERATPKWIADYGPYIFVITGIVAGYFLTRLLIVWLKELFGSDAAKSGVHGQL